MLQFHARFISNIIQFAGAQGADKGTLLAITGKTDLQELNELSLQFEAEVYNRVLEQALEQTGDSNFGLHTGEYLNLSAAGLIAQIVQNCSSIGEALHHIVEFGNISFPALSYQLKKQARSWELTLSPNPRWKKQSSEAVRHTLDAVVVFTLREYRTLTRQQFRPLRIHFSYPRPKQFLEYERLFKCPIHFDQASTSIFLDKAHVDEPIISSDHALLRLLVQYAEEKLAKLKQEAGFANVVQQSILHLVKPQFPTIVEVACNLNLSVRSLQRRLKNEGKTFHSLMEDLKHQLALDHLRKEKHSVKEIAYLLSYADASSFIRSFKRWTSLSPSEWRKKKLPGLRNPATSIYNTKA